MQPSWIDVVAPLCWPVVALGVLFGVGLARVKDRLGQGPRQVLGILVIAMVLVPLLLIIFEGNESLVMLADVDLLLLLLGGAAVWLAHRRWRVDAALRTFAFVFFGAAMIGFGGWSLIGDFLLPPDQFVGRITYASHRFRIKGPDEYRVWIDGMSFKTTAQVYGSVHTGERVRAEIGAGSRFILHAEQL
jgi:hypothetical protein